MNSTQSRGELNNVTEISSCTVIWLKYQLTTPEEKEMLYRFIITIFITSHSQNVERIKIHSFENYNFGHQLESLRVRVAWCALNTSKIHKSWDKRFAFKIKWAATAAVNFFTDFIMRVGRIATFAIRFLRHTHYKHIAWMNVITDCLKL